MFFLFVDISKINKFTTEKTDKHQEVIINSSYEKMYGGIKENRKVIYDRKKEEEVNYH